MQQARVIELHQNRRIADPVFAHTRFAIRTRARETLHTTKRIEVRGALEERVEEVFRVHPVDFARLGEALERIVVQDGTRSGESDISSTTWGEPSSCRFTAWRGVSEFLCVRRVQSHPPLGDGL